MTTRPVHALVMRTFDVVASAAALVVLSPVLAVIALVVRVTMGRPVLFTDQRAGRDGQPFRLVKFRTMRAPSADEQGYAHDAVRLTSVGRFLRSTSLDELPTLWNVLQGQMAIVGPRPLPVHYLPRYSAEHNRRHEVRPGITGWAQVNGRNALSWDERLDLDVWYVDHRSVRLDVRIIVRTMVTVARREGINHAGHATMPEFKGSSPRS
jgi:lipopolysaccharide/colanic/teichoic acid biosynthesis glycosyltransferase